MIKLKYCLTYLTILMVYTMQSVAQTTIENLQENTYWQMGIVANSRAVFAGQSLGIAGTEILPAITYYNKTGFYASLASATYTDASIYTKTKIAEVNPTIGFIKKGDVYNGDYSITHNQVLYGNKFFRNYLSNSICAENSFSITDNIELQGNMLFLFGNKLKRNTAVVLESKALYHFYLEDALGAEVVTISPAAAYFYGSDKLVSTFADRDTLSGDNKKVAVSNVMNMLSFIPGIEVNWQKNKHELNLGFSIPIANIKKNSSSLPIVTTHQIMATSPLFSISYQYYWSKAVE
jgi:hypothetical protein